MGGSEVNRNGCDTFSWSTFAPIVQEFAESLSLSFSHTPVQSFSVSSFVPYITRHIYLSLPVSIRPRRVYIFKTRYSFRSLRVAAFTFLPLEYPLTASRDVGENRRRLLCSCSCSCRTATTSRLLVFAAIDYFRLFAPRTISYLISAMFRTRRFKRLL